MSARPDLSVVENDLIGVVEDINRPRVAPRLYDLKFEYFETKMMMGVQPKIVVWFSICGFGEHHGIMLPRYYNARQLKGNPRRGGDFVMGKWGDFLTEYQNLFHIAPKRKDRISWLPYREHIIVGRVVDVKKDYKQRPLSKYRRWSKIGELLKVKEQ